jgi:hypothetical protein
VISCFSKFAFTATKFSLYRYNSQQQRSSSRNASVATVRSNDGDHGDSATALVVAATEEESADLADPFAQLLVTTEVGAVQVED